MENGTEQTTPVPASVRPRKQLGPRWQQKCVPAAASLWALTPTSTGAGVILLPHDYGTGLRVGITDHRTPPRPRGLREAQEDAEPVSSLREDCHTAATVARGTMSFRGSPTVGPAALGT